MKKLLLRGLTVAVRGTLLGALVVLTYIAADITYKAQFSKEAKYDKVRSMYAAIVAQTGQIQNRVPLFIVKNNEVNAYTNGHLVVIYTGLIDEAKSMDEIALVIGHEIAHVNLEHVGTVHEYPGESAVHEGLADKLGAFYAMKAGYDVCKGREFWERQRVNNGNYLGLGHPNYSYRYDELNVGCE